MLKLNKRLSFLAALVFIATACSEPDQEIFDAFTPEQLANSNNPVLTDVLKASAYQRIIGTWGGHNSLWALHEVASDEMVIAHKGADWEDGGMWIRTHRHEYGANEGAINNSWVYLYSAVGDINLLILQFPDVVALTAELRSLRALVYLWIIDSFGNAPIITETSANATPPNNSRQEIFEFIESSILDNIDNLSTDNTKTTVNKWVAHAVLAKLYLNAEVYTGTARYADAKTHIDAIINSGQFSLTNNFFSNFATQNDGSPENIFTIPYDENNAGGFNLVQMTLHYSSQATFDLQEQPWNGYASLEEFYNSFETGDSRKRSFVVGPQFASDGSRLVDASAEANDPDGPPLTFTPEINELRPNSLRQAGARVGKFEYATGSPANMSNDFPIFRYGDILLMKAEAEWKLGNNGVALDFMNQVRQRAGVDPLTSIDADILLAERGREMFAEGYRRSDMIRLGAFNDAWWEKPASDPSKNIYPIPTPQMNANPNLVQNPGYN